MKIAEKYRLEIESFIGEAQSQSEIIVAGAGRGGWYTAKVLEYHGLTIKLFVDNNENKHGLYLGYNVVSFKEGVRRYPEAIFLVALLDSKNCKPITSLLHKIGAKDVRYMMPSILYNYMANVVKRKCDHDEFGKAISYNYLSIQKEKKIVQSPTLSYVLTEKCTLNCKECGAFVPEIEHPETYTVDRIVDDITKYCSAFDIVHHIALQGGEPFLHRGLSSVIEKISTIPNLLFIDIVTNGTFIPKKDVIETVYTHGVAVIISDYGKYSRKLNEMTSCCNENNIFVDYHKYIDRNWGAIGPIYPRLRSSEENDKVFIECISDNKYQCCQLMDGQLHRCSFSNFTNKLEYIPNYSDDFVHLSNYDIGNQEMVARIREVALRKTALHACDHCPGNAREQLPAGMQVKRNKESMRMERELHLIKRKPLEKV